MREENGDSPAVPVNVSNEQFLISSTQYFGLSKREAFAMAIAGGSPAPVTGTGRIAVIVADRKAWAEKCVREADALLAALEESK